MWARKARFDRFAGSKPLVHASIVVIDEGRRTKEVKKDRLTERALGEGEKNVSMGKSVEG